MERVKEKRSYRKKLPVSTIEVLIYITKLYHTSSPNHNRQHGGLTNNEYQLMGSSKLRLPKLYFVWKNTTRNVEAGFFLKKDCCCILLKSKQKSQILVVCNNSLFFFFLKKKSLYCSGTLWVRVFLYQVFCRGLRTIQRVFAVTLW